MHLFERRCQATRSLNILALAFEIPGESRDFQLRKDENQWFDLGERYRAGPGISGLAVRVDLG